MCVCACVGTKQIAYVAGIKAVPMCPSVRACAQKHPQGIVTDEGAQVLRVSVGRVVSGTEHAPPRCKGDPRIWALTCETLVVVSLNQVYFLWDFLGTVCFACGYSDA